MSNAVKKSESLWMASADIANRAPLPEDTDVDDCIVGAGIAGLATAYLLGQAGDL